MDFIEILYTEF